MLEHEKYKVNLAAEGGVAVAAIAEAAFDLAIVDLKLGTGPDGLAVIAAARKSYVPVLVLTGEADVPSELASFNAGADDFISKPVSHPVLLARVRSLLRRSGRSEILEIDDLSIDRRSHRVTRSGQEIDLTAHEYKLLVLFMDHRNQVLSKSQILDHVWGHTYVSENSVEQRIASLRRKLNVFGRELITTVRGFGYRCE